MLEFSLKVIVRSVYSQRAFYTGIRRRREWSFASASRTDTSELTHCYHKYPAKFIPQLACSLLKEYSRDGDRIWDPFCGSGTLNLEAFRIGRDSVGSDLNPTAVMIARAKTNPIDPTLLGSYIRDLLAQLEASRLRSSSFYENVGVLNGNLSVLKKWYSSRNLRELSHVLWTIKDLDHPAHVRTFETCAFSSILKRCSYWLNGSVKPQIDPYKEPSSPYFYLKKQLQLMQDRNRQLFYAVGYARQAPRIFHHDATLMPPRSVGNVDVIITSPPYVVSYDYPDIFRLSTHFLFHDRGSRCFRCRFIGTRLSEGKIPTSVNGPIRQVIEQIDDVGIRHVLGQYYLRMGLFFDRARKSIAKGGRLVMVLGDTELRSVRVPNAYLLANLASQYGWARSSILERMIPLKILPTSRDRKTGRFTDASSPYSAKRYSKEYVVVLRAA